MTVRELLYEDENVYVTCDYISNRTKVALHLDIKKGKWSPSMFKKSKNVFKGLLEYFKINGYKEVYATPLENDIKAKKLISMFGFKEIYQAEGLIVMKIEI